MVHGTSKVMQVCIPAINYLLHRSLQSKYSIMQMQPQNPVLTLKQYSEIKRVVMNLKIELLLPEKIEKNIKIKINKFEFLF